jgi:2,3-bisphosphoglycerate-independent phosphoglycerate mutase
MRVLFIFLDGIGLGEDNAAVNPLADARMPNLSALLEGRSLIKSAAPFHGEHATLLGIDPAVGVEGLPQSATGQAILLTGKNIPAELGYHYGPKPNREIAAYLNGDTLFSRCVETGKKAALLNAYPPRYFDGIDSGKRLYSSIPLAVTNAGLSLFTREDFFAGRALSADFTGQGWRDMLGFKDAPIMSEQEAGRKLAVLARQYDFSLFEYWASDYAGHKQDFEQAVKLMESFDGVVGGLVEELKVEGQRSKVEGRRLKVEGQGSKVEEEGLKDELLVLVTSDHGNMEDVSTRKHTDAKVPLLVIGSKTAREEFTRGMTDLTHVAPAVWRAVMQN